jgi:plastocyanin
MRRHRIKTLIAGTATLVAVAAAGPLSSGVAAPSADTAGKKATVKVGDDFFSPASLKVKKGTKVKWKWLDSNFNSHNVTLKKAPKGVKKKNFKSATGSIGIKFSKKLEKKGSYFFVCTIHSTVMTQTIKVKK